MFLKSFDKRYIKPVANVKQEIPKMRLEAKYDIKKAYQTEPIADSEIKIAYLKTDLNYVRIFHKLNLKVPSKCIIL